MRIQCKNTSGSRFFRVGVSKGIVDIVEGEIIIELKAVQHLLSIHETQLVNYLTATHKDHGLLINFGGDRIEIKRKYREYKRS